MKELKKLIDFKNILTFLVTIGAVYGFIVGKVNTEQYMTIVTMTFTFYFAKGKIEKNKGDEE